MRVFEMARIGRVPSAKGMKINTDQTFSTDILCQYAIYHEASQITITL